MNPSFNVLSDPWIPVVRLDGSHDLLSLRETLKQAQDLKEISTVSPLEEFSVYRFLSVFLMDALRPKRLSSIRTILSAGSFDMEQIERYIALCESEGVSFDLFDENRPFMQAPYVKEWDGDPESISRLDFTMPSGTNHTHFVHRSNKSIELCNADAFRKLLATYIFATQGGSGYSPSINGTPPYMVLVNGDNLFRTLCFQMVPLGERFPCEEQPAIWNGNEIEPKKEITDVSFFQAMIFPVRRISFIPNEDGKTVSEVYYSSGYKYGGTDGWTDPNVAYGRSPDGKRYALRPDLVVAVWRNYSELVRREGRPEVISRYVKIDSGWDNATVTLYGLQASQASCENLIRHSLQIPRNILSDEYETEWIEKCIAEADALGKQLERALRVALQYEKHDADKKRQKKANAKAKEVSNTYFTRCEPLFWKLIQDACKQRAEELKQALGVWRKCIFKIAQAEFNKAVSSMHANGKMLRQITEGEQILYAWDKSKREGY